VGVLFENRNPDLILLKALRLEVGVKLGDGAPEEDGVPTILSLSKGGGMWLDIDGAAIEEDVIFEVAEPVGEAAEDSL
jgi:hypothetical protein